MYSDITLKHTLTDVSLKDIPGTYCTIINLYVSPIRPSQILYLSKKYESTISVTSLDFTFCNDPHVLVKLITFQFLLSVSSVIVLGPTKEATQI